MKNILECWKKSYIFKGKIAHHHNFKNVIYFLAKKEMLILRIKFHYYITNNHETYFRKVVFHETFDS